MNALLRPSAPSPAPCVYGAFLVDGEAVALSRSAVTGGALLLVEGGLVALTPKAARQLLHALACFVADAEGV